MGLVKFYGQQFVIAVLMLLLFAALATGVATPVLELAGRAAASGPLGLTVALFFLGVSLELAVPSRWHAAYTATLTHHLSSSTPGVTELAAIGTMLAPLLAGYFLLQLATNRAPKHRDEVLYGRTWPWVAASLLLLGGVVGVFWLLH